MEKQDIFLGASLIGVIISTLLLWPFADAILWAIFTAYFLHYFADYLNEHINNRTLTTAIMILILIGFVSGLFYLLLTTINAEQIRSVTDEFSGILFTSVDVLSTFFDVPSSLQADLKATISDLTQISSSHVIGMISEIPAVIINILVYFVVAAFLLKDGKRFKNDLFSVLHSLPGEYRSISMSVVKSVDRLFRGVFLTYLTVAITIGALATLGFYVLGVEFYWGWGLIIGVFAFFPVVSAPMVYVPLSLFYIANNEFWWGITILMYGIIILNTLPEVLFRPYLAASHTQEHPLLLFVGFIVGPLVLGLKGIILGPMILVVTKNLLTMRYWDVDPNQRTVEDLAA